MIGIVATLKIKEGSGSDFEAVANQLVEKVNANEEGVVYYDLYKEDETTYVFLERYKNEEAQASHGKTEYFKELGAKMGAFMAGAPEIKVLQSV
jgi:quinol monooxygenase YgiN